MPEHHTSLPGQLDLLADYGTAGGADQAGDRRPHHVGGVTAEPRCPWCGGIPPAGRRYCNPQCRRSMAAPNC